MAIDLCYSNIGPKQRVMGRPVEKMGDRLGVGARRQRPAAPVDGDGLAAGAHVPRRKRHGEPRPEGPGNLWRFYRDLMGFKRDLMGFNRDLMGFNRDLSGFNMIFIGIL